MNFVISFILFVCIGAIVSPPIGQVMHPNQLAKLSFAQAKSVVKNSGIVLDQKVFENILMHHDARDESALNIINSMVRGDVVKAFWMLKFLSKNPSFDVTEILTRSINDNDLKLSYMLLKTTPTALPYALEYSLRHSKLGMFKIFVEKLAPEAHHPALVDAIEFSKKTGNLEALNYLENYVLLKNRQDQAKARIHTAQRWDMDLNREMHYIQADLNLDVHDLNFAFQIGDFNYAENLLRVFKPDVNTLNIILKRGGLREFEKILNIGVKPDGETLHILAKNRNHLKFQEFVNVFKSRQQSLEYHLGLLLDAAAINDDQRVIKLLVEDIGIKPTEETVAVAATGNGEAYTYLSRVVSGEDTEALSEYLNDLDYDIWELPD